MVTNQLRILSYNLLYHKAYCELNDLANDHHPDIICLQECNISNLDTSVGNLELCAKTSANPDAMAIYYNPQRFDLKYVTPLSLPLSVYERIAPNERKLPRQRQLIIAASDIQTGKDIVISSFHAIHLVATNRARRKQISHGLSSIVERNDTKCPAIMIGDYNYPLFHAGLRRHVAKHGYELIKSNRPTYKNKLIGGYFDFAATANISSAQLMTLPFGTSDHAPILLTFEI
jgi:exodeoxyribonuclease III